MILWSLFCTHFNWPLTRYVKLQVGHEPEMPGMFSLPLTSKETASWWSWHASRQEHDACAVMHVGIVKTRWQGKRSRHYWCMHNPQFYISGKRPMDERINQWLLCSRDSDIMTPQTGRMTGDDPPLANYLNNHQRSTSTEEIKVQPLTERPPDNLWVVAADDPALQDSIMTALVHGGLRDMLRHGWHFAEKIFNTFSWKKIFVFWCKSHWSLNPNLCHHVASLGHNELTLNTYTYLVMIYFNIAVHNDFRTNRNVYCQTSNIRHTLVGNRIVDHSGVVGASPVGAAPTTSSFST